MTKIHHLIYCHFHHDVMTVIVAMNHVSSLALLLFGCTCTCIGTSDGFSSITFSCLLCSASLLHYLLLLLEEKNNEVRKTSNSHDWTKTGEQPKKKTKIISKFIESNTMKTTHQPTQLPFESDKFITAKQALNTGTHKAGNNNDSTHNNLIFTNTTDNDV